jgi:(4S)-4-hydroxy-5-phosphonooxypentane-2,3-dione isomerase
MIVLVVNWMAHEGRETDVVRTFTKLADASRAEPGCRMYVVHQHTENPRHFLVYEQYDNDEALQAHRDSAHFQQYAAKELPQLGTRVDGNLFTPIT